MKILAAAVLHIALVAPIFAAESAAPVRVQTGKISTARLLAAARGAQSAPDGIRFLFVVFPAKADAGDFTLKETRDFLIDGKSYQEATRAELGKNFEPVTNVTPAEQFFEKQPNLKPKASVDLAGAYVVSVAIGGATLPPPTTGKITITVGFNKEVESFTFDIFIPPGTGPGAAKKVVNTGA